MPCALYVVRTRSKTNHENEPNWHWALFTDNAGGGEHWLAFYDIIPKSKSKSNSKSNSSETTSEPSLSQLSQSSSQTSSSSYLTVDCDARYRRRRRYYTDMNEAGSRLQPVADTSLVAIITSPRQVKSAYNILRYHPVPEAPQCTCNFGHIDNSGSDLQESQDLCNECAYRVDQGGNAIDQDWVKSCVRELYQSGSIEEEDWEDFCEWNNKILKRCLTRS